MTEDTLPILPKGFELVVDKSISPKEILAVLEEEVTPEAEDVWRKCIEQSLFVIGVRQSADQRLVGFGMLAGNQRHAELVDGNVHLDFRRMGIGKVILTQRIDYARREKIKYISLTYDKKNPWLKDYYERYGFKSIDFGMWISDSLETQ